jgi:uncharacterized protein (TIGR02001 family)
MDARNILRFAGAAGISVIALTGTASADGYDEPGTPLPVVVDEGRKFTYSFNIGGTSDYVFRGVSQTSTDPALQGGADMSYGIFYAGTWASAVDFDDAPPANAEVDWYGGIRPTWQSPLGPMNLDFGVIYYSYPGADPSSVGLNDPNYVELKAGYTWSVVHPSLTTGTTVFWSPDYFGETGSVWTIETAAAWAFPKVAFFTPVLSGLVGWQKGNTDDGYFVNVIGTDDEYYYWNVGLALGVDNLTFDLRYWDTNIGKDAANICAAAELCDQRFVFGVKVAVP